MRLQGAQAIERARSGVKGKALIVIQGLYGIPEKKSSLEIEEYIRWLLQDDRFLYAGDHQVSFQCFPNDSC
jgi:hypothetical protein